MNKISDIITLLAEDRYMPWLCAIPAALVAIWIGYQTRGVINPDGILYVEVARLFDQGAWREGFATYNWPLYPSLMMLVHRLTGLDYLAAAHLLAVLFFAFTAAGIVTLVRELGGSRRTMLLALVLLIASPCLTGDILPMIVREHGYWALQVWGLVYFLRFLKDRVPRHALLWGLFAVGSVLFRIEGLTYLLGVPLLLLVETSRPLPARLADWLKANALVLLLAAVVLGMLLLNPSISLRDMGRLYEPLTIAELVYQQLTTGLSLRAETIGRDVLGDYLDDYAMAMLLSGLLTILLTKAATVGGLLQTVLAAVCWQRIRARLEEAQMRLLVWILLLTMVNATVILVKGFILPTRLLSPLGLVVIILAAFALDDLLRAMQRPSSNWGRWQQGAMALAVVMLVVQAGLALRPTSPKKRYEQDAVEWVLAQASPGERVYFQTKRLRYYAGEPMHRDEDWLTIQESRWRRSLREVRHDKDESPPAFDRNFMDAHDYFVFNVKKSSDLETMLMTTLGKPTRIFEGNRRNQVLVYKKESVINK